MSFKKQSGRGGGGRDQVKSMKEADPDGLDKTPMQASHLGPSKIQQRKQFSSKVANEMPNYIKYTSRFDASMDKLQVSTNSLTSSCKIKSMNDSENPISSQPVSSSDHPGSKDVAKEVVWNSGLKPVRSLMKKNSGVGLHPTLNLSRATCSSTVKISRNQEGLDLDEPNCASKSMLCSYKYCSLHGQKKHEASFPALKCFLSARRQSVKVPNILKHEEQSSARKNGRNEIYSKQQEGALQLQSCEERSQDEVKIVDIVKGINWMILGDHDETNQLQESYSVTSFEDYADNNSEISIERMEVFGERIKYIEDERQEEAHLETEEGKTNYVGSEEAAVPYLHSQSNYSQCFDDFLGKTQDSIQESRDECCKFTPRQENTLSMSNHDEADSKLFPEADSKLLLEAEDVKEDHEILQSKTFSYANVEEESEDSAYGSLQSEVELLNYPKELQETDMENLKVNCEEKHDMKSNVENDGCCKHFKHETDYESQKSKINNYDKGGDISIGLDIEKKNVTNYASFISENPLAELTNRPKARYSATRKIIAENQEKKGSIACPRPPRFLPLKPEQEAEEVNLKHKTVEERKATEEWMIDYALRKTLRRMAPARKRKVALLVAAFESVIQQEQGTTVL